MGRIGNGVRIFSGPTTVMGSFIRNATRVISALGRPDEVTILSQETCLSAWTLIDNGKVCSLFVNQINYRLFC